MYLDYRSFHKSVRRMTILWPVTEFVWCYINQQLHTCHYQGWNFVPPYKFCNFVKEALERYLNNNNCNRKLGFTLSQAWSPVTNLFINVNSGPDRSYTRLRPLTLLSGHQLWAKCSCSVPWSGRTSEVVSPTDRLVGHFPDDRGGNGSRNSGLDAMQLPDAAATRE